MIGQGDIFWVDLPDRKPRPGLLITRSETIPVLHDLMVAPITTRIRQLPTEVNLGELDGVPRPCVANLQHVDLIPKSALVRRAGRLAGGRWHEVCAALQVAIAC